MRPAELDDDYFTTTKRVLPDGAVGLDETTDNGSAVGVGGHGCGPFERDTDGQGAGPTGVAYPPFGLTPRQLADAQKAFTGAARWRMYGVGADQYDRGTFQQCEDMDLARLFLEARSELLDLCNYLAYIDIRLERLHKKVEGT